MAELKKVLSFRSILLITINSMMGTGIFFLPAVGAAVAGPASLISWLILSVIAIYIGICFAELVSMYPTSGGIYEFCKHAFGRFPSFLIGWLTLITANITLAMLIIGAIQYLLPYEGVQIQFLVVLVSIVFILLFNYIAYRGMKTSATMLIVFSVITLFTLFSLIAPGLFHFDAANLQPFFVESNFMILLAVFFIAETFFGWESSTFLAGETKDGAKVVPKALILGTIAIAIISCIFVLVSLGSVSWQAFGNSASPFLLLASSYYGAAGVTIFTLLVYLSIIGSVAGWVVSAPRLILSMSKDKLFITHFAKIHHKYQTPYRAIIFQTIVSIIFVIIGVGSYLTLLHLLVPLLLILYSCIMIAVVVLRYKKPNMKRHVKAPFGTVGPILLVIFFMSLLVLWLVHTHSAISTMLLGLSFFVIGFPLYLLIQMYHNPKMIRIIDDLLAYITLWTERFTLPLGVRKEIVHLVGNIDGKTVLEFGCSVGTLTMHLAEKVGPAGKIWATNISAREANLTRLRAQDKGHHHVEVLHDTHHSVRVHPKIPKIHTVVSVGSLGYMQDVKKILKEMNKKLKKGSKICFVDYDKFFDIIPNVEWLNSDHHIKSLFSRCGFSVSVMRKQGFAWKYIYIYGVKEKEIK